MVKNNIEYEYKIILILLVKYLSPKVKENMNSEK